MKELRRLKEKKVIVSVEKREWRQSERGETEVVDGRESPPHYKKSELASPTGSRDGN